MEQAAGDRRVPAVRHRRPIPPLDSRECRDMTTVEDALDAGRAPKPVRGCCERPRETTGVWSWFTTVDHKKIAILYGTTALVFFVVGGIEALLDPPAARGARRHGALGGPVQPVLHDARHDDGLPHGHAARGRVRQLPRAADDRRARRRVPAPQHVRLLDVPVRRDLHLLVASSSAARPNGGWFGYAPLTSTPMSTGLPARSRPRLLGHRADHARHRLGRDRRQLHRHRRSTCARPA